MTKLGAKLPYQDTRIVKVVSDRIDELSPRKTQRQIAAEMGYEKPNVLSMYKRGEAKFPLDRLPAMAAALDMDLAYLFQLGLEQWWPDAKKEIEQMFSDRIVTANQREWLTRIQEMFGDRDPPPTSDRLDRLKEVVERQTKAAQKEGVGE